MSAKRLPTSLDQLRSFTVNNTLFKPTSLKAAVSQFGFIQADPIRSPARAQDLILRHRVKNYRAGDLERRYSLLDIEEDYLYAYGFLTKENWQLLHPRHSEGLSKPEKLVLKLAAERGELHPRDLRPHLGDERQINAWGGFSKVSTRLMEDLHYRGLLRITRREEGIKIYGPAGMSEQLMEPKDRLKKLVLLISSILGPTAESRLRTTLNHLRYAAPTLEGRAFVIKELLNEGELEQRKIDGVNYVWPTGTASVKEAPPVVRFLAPFDPLVWDRTRFEHLWDWEYRFEAYTPPPKRKMGYYAMPLMWHDKIIGWANVSVKSGKLEVETGFVNTKPKERAFRVALDEEIDSMRYFLAVNM
jgi:uncharacterized protein